MTETSYTYLSDGIKRNVCTHDGLGKLYRGSFVYDGGSDVGSSVSLESVATPEGRLDVTTDGILDLWYAKDYLGNVRSVIDLASGVIEENDYLPFGTRIQDDNQPVMSDNRWRYANKEEQSSLVGGSCKLIDFGARNYDPWSARWTTIDPMAQKYTGMSPYNYCAGNPVMLVDPVGSELTDYYSASGKYITRIDDGKNDVKMLVDKKMSLEDAIRVNAVFPLPSDEVLSMMDCAYTLTEENGNEHGFQVDVNGNVGDMGEGDEGSISIPYVHSKTGEYVEYDVHTHPQQPCDSNSYYESNAVPSDADKSHVVGNSPNIVLGYKGDFGVQTRMIGFYDKTGSISLMPYNSFITSVRKAQRDLQKRYY